MLFLLPNQIAWIKQLAAEGLSQREICEATGLRRKSVRKVIAPSAGCKQHLALVDTIYDVDEPFFTDPPRRCEDCGAFCYMPCLRCYLKKLREEQSTASSGQSVPADAQRLEPEL
jgi:hypothetical protein